jgi:monoamine oxidase
MPEQVLDVAVVGGGVSGIYSAYRLLTEGKARHVTVFEASDHIGGRLLSIPAPKIPNMVAELGGMRILPATQPRIWTLIHLLNKDSGANEKITLYDFPVDQPENLSYLRGVHLRLFNFTHHPSRVPYHLTYQEWGRSSGQILVNAIEQIVPGITAKGLTEDQRRAMAQAASFAGAPLYQQGFWNVLSRIISGEAYQFGIDSGGYQTTLSNWNAADAIPWFLSDFGIDPVYKGFSNGFQQVPLTLEALFKKAEGHVELNRHLQGFAWNEKAKFFTLQFKDGGSIDARTLILAMPRRSLDLLAPNSPLLSDIPELIKSVTPRPLFKLFTTYQSPWWRMAGTNMKNPKTGETEYVPLQKGRTTTDLPLRQTYYWVYGNGDPVVSGRGMLMASYDDGTNIGYWDGLRFKRGRGWREETEDMAKVVEAFEGEADRESDSSTARWRKYHAPRPMVEEIQRQLKTVHCLSFVPYVVDACYKDWGDDPFGGGWNSWNIGVHSEKVKRQIIQPFNQPGRVVPLYICGEAYSDAQGWVEGALQTADMMLEKFGIKPFPPVPVKKGKG